jgi:hypothetical protein
VEFENEAWISNNYEINPNSLPQEIQISDPLLMGTFFPNNKMRQGACWPNSNKFQGPENFQ